MKTIAETRNEVARMLAALTNYDSFLAYLQEVEAKTTLPGLSEIRRTVVIPHKPKTKAKEKTAYNRKGKHITFHQKPADGHPMFLRVYDIIRDKGPIGAADVVKEYLERFKSEGRTWDNCYGSIQGTLAHLKDGSYNASLARYDRTVPVTKMDKLYRVVT